MGGYTPPPPAKSTGGCSGGCLSQSQLEYNYVAVYLNAHAFAPPSYRYMYILAFVFFTLIILAAIFHHSNFSRGSTVGTWYKTWAMKNRVIKLGPKPQPGAPPPTRKRRIFVMPSIGKMLLLAFLAIVPIVLTLVGADYIRPTASVFDMAESWPDANVRYYRRGMHSLAKRIHWGLGTYPSVSTVAPSVSLPYRDWWTSGDRTGDMVNALTPFVVLLAMKQVPFALLSTRIFGGWAPDHLSFLHSWGGRIVWLFATVHVATWSVNLAKDSSFGRSMWAFVFMWPKFRWGVVSYIFLTILTALSIGPVRKRAYESFYVIHVVCSACFMIAGAFHHPPVAHWLLAALTLWALERVARAIKVAWINGIGFAGRKPQSVSSVGGEKMPHPTADRRSDYTFDSQRTRVPESDSSSHTLHNGGPQNGNEMYGRSRQQASYGPRLQSPPTSPTFQGKLETDPLNAAQLYQSPLSSAHGYAAQGNGQGFQPMVAPPASRYELQDPQSADSPLHSSADQYKGEAIEARRVPRPIAPRPAMPADIAAVIQPGFAFAQLLPGKTMRLTLRTPNRISWRPGQWVNLNVPSVRFWESHPFTIASAHDAPYPTSTRFREEGDDVEHGSSQTIGEERTMVLLLRARKGFTLRLWNYIREQRELQLSAAAAKGTGGRTIKAVSGVHVRALIDGPFGTVGHVRWGEASTILIVCGGSGVSFGMALLEHMCACMAGAAAYGRSGKGGRRFFVRRVRFVWILREFSHLQWIASALRRCVEMVPPEQLQVQLFVTHFNDRIAAPQRPPPPQRQPLAPQDRGPYGVTQSADGYLATPNPSFLAHGHGGSGPSTPDEWSSPAYLSAPSFSGGYSGAMPRVTDGPEQEELELDPTLADLTHFEGEDTDGPDEAERAINSRVRNEGKIRRAHTRKTTLKRKKGRGATEDSAAATTLEAQRAMYEGRSMPPPQQAAAGVSPGLLHQQQQHAWGPPERDIGAESSDAHYDAGLRRPHDAHGSGGSMDIRDPFASGSNSPSSMPGTPTRPHALLPHTHSNLHHHHPHGGEEPATRPGHGRTKTGTTLGSIFSESYESATSSTANLLQSLRTPKSSSSGSVPHGAGPRAGKHDQQQELGSRAPIDLDEFEDRDLRVVAELARPGHPRLDAILADEISRSRAAREFEIRSASEAGASGKGAALAGSSVGKTIVAVCGPGSLSSVMRSVVVKQLEPGRVARGDPTGDIELVTEAYEWGG